MKKGKLLVAAVLLCVMGLTGCGNDYHATESTVFVEKKGKIVTTDVESFPEDTYDKAELEEYINGIISDYNEANGDKSVVLESLKVEDDDYAIKPMSCPGGMLVYKLEPRSYKELPMRMGELGLVHRNEKSGTLHGLMRVRSFTQDDAHILMREDQVMDEIQGVMRLIDEVYQKFGFSYEIELSTRPEHSIGSDEDWHLATEALEKAVQGMGKSYVVNEGDGAFYGPKLDFHLKDSIGRTWQDGTIQLDFQLPQRFDIDYIGADGEKHRPIMLHRVVFGSIERFIGILIEHYAGKFPAWIAPVQVKILPVSDKYNDYAKKVAECLNENDIRVEMDNRSEKLGYKIREARMDKVPYMIIVGENEQNNKSVSVRQRDAEIDKQELGEMKIEHLIELVKRGANL